MKNKIVKLFSIIVLSIVTFFAFSCAGDSFVLKEDKYWLDRYEEIDVELSKGDASALTWTSADTTIVTVENGRLIAQGKGKTTVSVTDGKTTKEIAITVRNSGVKPKIGFTELNAYIGVETEIPGLMNYAGKQMYTTIDYTLDLEDDTYLKVNGNKIEGLKLGEVQGTLSAEWKGLQLSQEVTCKVYNSVYMTTESETVEIHNVESKLGRAPLGIHLYEMETEMSELIEYEIVSGDNCVRIEDGTVYAKAEGQAEVKATYTKYGIEATATVQVNVLPNYVAAQMVKPATQYSITYEKYSGSVDGRQSDDMYKYCAGDTINKGSGDENNVFQHRVVNKDVDEKVMDLYRKGYRYFTFDVYYTSNENLMVGCHNYTEWLSVGNLFRLDYLTIISDGEVTNRLMKNQWITLCYDLKALWEITFGMPANIFFFVQDATAECYLMNVRYYLDDKFIPSENRTYEDKGDYVQATNDEFDVAVPVSKNYSLTTGKPAVVVTDDTVPVYAPYNATVDGRTGAYQYYTQKSGKDTNALVVSTSMNASYADGMWRMSQKGGYLAWDIYPAANSTITFSMNGGKKTITVKVDETNVFAEESWFTVIKDGAKQGVLTANKWQTVVIAFADNYDDSGLLSNITFSVYESDVTTYVDNVRYYKEGTFIPTAYAEEKYAPYIVESGASVSLNRVETGSFKGAYEYVNGNVNGGALSFKGIQSENGGGGTFFAQGYKYVKFHLYLASGVQTVTVSATGEKNFTAFNKTLTVGESIASNKMYVFNADETQTTVLGTGKWYTVYIPVSYASADVGTPNVSFSVNGDTQGNPATAYLKYVTFEYAVNVPIVGPNSNYSHLVSLEYQQDGAFAGSWKYVNRSSGNFDGATKNWGESGVHFSRMNEANGYKQGAFFIDGYKWVKADFYMTDSVPSFCIRFSAGKNNAYWVYNIGVDTLIGQNVYVTDLDGNRLNVIPSNEWFTLYIPADVLSTDDNYYIVSVYTNGGDETEPAVAYLKNIEYLKEYDVPEYPTKPTGSINVSLHLKQDNGVIPTGMSIEKQTSGEFAGAYKYTNGQYGVVGTHSYKWGELGVFFNEIFNANFGYNAEQQMFFALGYKYLVFDFYAGSNVYSLDLRHGGTVGEGWVQQLQADTAFTSNVFAIYDANGNQVNKWTAGAWYTLVIKPVEGKRLCIQTNSQTTDVVPVMYLKNLSYKATNPFFQTTLAVSDSHGSTLEKQTDGDFAGAYKYTNTSKGTVGGKYGDAGFYFNEVFPVSGGHSTDFHDEGFEYITIEFYATASVYSISFAENWMSAGNPRWWTITAGQTLPENEIFAIYNANGEKVNAWTQGEWFTLVIKPHTDTAGSYTYPLRIQSNAETAASDVPVMYLRNATYCVENPYAGNEQ